MPHSHPLSVEFASEAELDFIDILIYTEQTFGSRQTEVYAEWINTAIARVAQNPEFGKKISKPGYSRYHISWVGNRGSHYLYYRFTEHTLQIARILHQSRDYTKAYPFNE